MTIANPAVMIYRKVLRVNPMCSHHKEEFLFLLFIVSIMRTWMLTELIVVIISKYMHVKSVCCICCIVLYVSYVSVRMTVKIHFQTLKI